MKKCDWNICRSAAVVAVLALSFAVRGGELLDCGKAKPENVILHTPEKRGQSVRIESLEQGSEKFDSIKYKNQRSAKLIFDPKLIPINQK